MQVKKTLKGHDGFTRVYPIVEIGINDINWIPRTVEIIDERNGESQVRFLNEGEAPLADGAPHRIFRLHNTYVVAQYEEM